MNNTSYVRTPNEKEYNNMMAARLPGLIWIVIAYTVSLILKIKTVPAIEQYVIFTILIILFTTIYCYSNLFLPRKFWLYFVLQSFIVYISAFFTQDIPVIIITLYPLLVGQAIGTAGRKKNYLFLMILVLFTINTLVMVPGKIIDTFLIITLPIMVVIVSYAVIFFNQVNARIRTQYMLEEIELAHQQVERLTLHNERQRMARDLHDTLAQGLAGLKMQLEATNLHLTKGNDKRAQEIVVQSMKRVSELLADARLTIDNLRLHAKEKYDFQQSIIDEVQHFTVATGLECHFKFRVMRQLSSTISEHCLRIITECLSNIARHAKATNVWISIEEKEKVLFISVKDDGVGFNIDMEMSKGGHYGLLGIQERVRIIGGKVDINSKKDKGTNIQINIPLRGAE
ncbi:sensor histidine kinase [Priestia megaterium]|uniref:sensor histidine kinase n=1 Tax=Priestia megaterium TaxID=1404 RepID=UPI00077D8AC6|nr:sensor histidine kinase [Priestia megaterium]MED4761375.1 sensor histidine kinase [Priestia megaterium]QLK07286.1 two-component sensor histidine kinase [Priestia megaterium]